MRTRNKIAKNIYSDLIKTGVPTKDVCKALSITTKTFYSRVADPDSFTAREIKALRKFCSKETCDMITE